ncbi:acyltransferase [uncultured Thomasclavelia sp.]|uniref:acyltransferase family protein n=1 Tax=uncultured Thomasclavelia sp. TaxID=3025759 RepID=UPI00262902BD|nr:acyltransferase [uncultured Thomasclavelia sp.]
MSKKYLNYICFLQVIGPIFVILGHSLNGFDNYDGLWRVFSKNWIYIFHMPLFFFISGYLLSYNGWLGKKSYSQFVKNKFNRLIIPYLFWNILFLIPKFLGQNFLTDNVNLSLGFFLNLIVTPRQNIWGHTWFLACLFLFYLATPIWKYIIDDLRANKLIMFIFFAIMLYILPIKTQIFCLNDIHKEILFFGIGAIIGLISENELKHFFKFNWFAIFILAIVTSMIRLFILDINEIDFVPAFFIIFCLFGVPLKFKFNTKDTTLLSKYSFTIYILHWPIMLSTRILLYQISHLNMYLVITLMVIFGYFIPLTICLIKKKLNFNNRFISYLLAI